MAKKKSGKKTAKSSKPVARPYDIKRLERVLKEVCGLDFKVAPLLKELEEHGFPCHRNTIRRICGDGEQPETLPTNLILFLHHKGTNLGFIYNLSDEMRATTGLDPDDLAYLLERSKNSTRTRSLREMAELLEDNEKLAAHLENAARARE